MSSEICSNLEKIRGVLVFLITTAYILMFLYTSFIIWVAMNDHSYLIDSQQIISIDKDISFFLNTYIYRVPGIQTKKPKKSLPCIFTLIIMDLLTAYKKSSFESRIFKAIGLEVPEKPKKEVAQFRKEKETTITTKNLILSQDLHEKYKTVLKTNHMSIAIDFSSQDNIKSKTPSNNLSEFSSLITANKVIWFVKKHTFLQNCKIIYSDIYGEDTVVEDVNKKRMSFQTLFAEKLGKVKIEQLMPWGTQMDSKSPPPNIFKPVKECIKLPEKKNCVAGFHLETTNYIHTNIEINERKEKDLNWLGMYWNEINSNTYILRLCEDFHLLLCTESEEGLGTLKVKANFFWKKRFIEIFSPSDFDWLILYQKNNMLTAKNKVPIGDILNSQAKFEEYLDVCQSESNRNRGGKYYSSVEYVFYSMASSCKLGAVQGKLVIRMMSNLRKFTKQIYQTNALLVKEKEDFKKDLLKKYKRRTIILYYSKYDLVFFTTTVYVNE